MSPVPIILAALASAGRSGGGESTVENVCPPVGSSATVAKNANAVFHPGIYSGWDMVYLTSSIGLGAQTLTGELTASQAAQVATGQSPGIVLWFFRGFSDNVASIDSVVAAYDWVN